MLKIVFIFLKLVGRSQCNSAREVLGVGRLVDAIYKCLEGCCIAQLQGRLFYRKQGECCLLSDAIKTVRIGDNDGV